MCDHVAHLFYSPTKTQATINRAQPSNSIITCGILVLEEDTHALGQEGLIIRDMSSANKVGLSSWIMHLW
jgi:hypothetical protein